MIESGTTPSRGIVGNGVCGILDEMERDFGISCPSAVQKDQYQGEIPDVEKHDSALRSTLHFHQEEVGRAQSTIVQMEEEKNKVVGTLASVWFTTRVVGLHQAWRSGGRSPSYWPAAGMLSPDLGSPPFPGSPLLHRRTSRGLKPLSAGGDVSPLGSVNSCSPCPSPVSLESETDRLNRYIERLKARNERLTAALEQRKGESEQITVTLSRLESDCSALQLALKYWTPELVNREAVLRQQIERLKRDRAAILLPRPSPGVETKLSPESSPPAGSRGGPVSKDNFRPLDAKKEKASVFCELISVREEMSDLRSLIRLKEKELRCLEWSLMAQKAQEAAGVFVPESVREEQEDRKTEQQRLYETTAKLGSDGDIAESRARPILKELQAVLQREQALKKRLALVHDSSNAALSDSASHRRDNGEQIARLTQAHSKALSSYRQIRRKYREQVWRLEQKVAAVTESHQNQSGAPKTTGEATEWRREETVL
ncbi:hypothetical protein F2P81_005472 [Scophthalmus maximus]|uniref:Harmonin-binding protein USHBP1 PDZ-binding domain-containing protein n=1 Tax=Scophthalmus maximus TaxID=52904 RepID=A0A6A4TDP9_SCOMX|nr:hypothetical protein F2P81_005472 [Scophthalmus maximus]